MNNNEILSVLCGQNSAIINSDKNINDIHEEERNYCYCCGRLTIAHVRTGKDCDGSNIAWFVCDDCDKQ